MQTNAEQYKLMPYENLKVGTQDLYYDKNWQSSKEENGYYMITVEISLQNKNNSVVATFNQNAKFVNNHIFNLETKKFFKKDDGN